VNPECKYRSVGPPPLSLRGPRYEELTISMVECEGLALITLARIEKMTKVIEGLLVRVAIIQDLLVVF
jgi:hypothetical protein